MLIRNVARLMADTAAFALATRKISLLFVVIAAVVLVALTLLVQVATPLAIYPFV